MDMSTTKQFIRDLRKRCKEVGVKLILRRSCQLSLGGGQKCSGYFCDNERVIVVARKHTEWLAILVHEFSHMEQWLENSILWQKELACGNSEFGRWLDGKEVKGINKAITNIINLELDADKRALKKIKDYDLPINTVTYIQKANEYILSYRHMLKTRKWDNNVAFDGKFKRMPSRFMSGSYYKSLSPKIEKIFLEAA